MSTPPRILGGPQARKRGQRHCDTQSGGWGAGTQMSKRSKRHCDPQPASRRGGVPRRRQRHFERARGFIPLTGRRTSGGNARFDATACAARAVLSHKNDSRVDSSNAMRAAHAVAPNLAYPPQWRLPTTDIKPLARSKCRRRRRDAPPCRRHARGGGRFPVLLPLRARNRLWFGPTKHFRVGRYMANRRSINSKRLPQCVYWYFEASRN